MPMSENFSAGIWTFSSESPCFQLTSPLLPSSSTLRILPGCCGLARPRACTTASFSGQPWTKRLGYDYNGDGYNSDRAPGVERNGENGPVYRNVSLRITKAFSLPSAGRFEIIAEAFNLFNTVNYDVTSVNAGQYLGGPTIANPKAAYVPNPLFGTYSATLPAREIQLGVRWSF